MKTLAEFKSKCTSLGITVGEAQGRPSKEPYLAALKEYLWRQDHPDESLPPQIAPMLLGNWDDLDPEAARRIEQDDSGWVVSPKLDGVRSILHVERGRVRLTSRCVSEVTYRFGEFQDNLPHLTTGLSALEGTILDGELVFPGPSLDTGRTVAVHQLHAATAILSTNPEKARRMQAQPDNRLRFHVFDILKSGEANLTPLPLRDRLDHLARSLAAADNPFFEPVPVFSIGRLNIHRRILDAGGEGTVWKQLDQPYEPGRRVDHWLKRKRETTLEAFVSGFKPGSPDHGHQDLVGAVEFSAREADGSARPVGWVSNWTACERRNLTDQDHAGGVLLNPTYIGRRALLIGQDYSAKSGRLRHAKHHCWLDP